MKNKKSLFLVIGSVLIIAFIYNNFFLKSMIVGEYINKNYDREPSVPEVPYELDTLRLFDNNKFTSHFWGSGTYRIIHGFGGTKIELMYQDEFGRADFTRSLTRLWFGKPKFLLDVDFNHYFEKSD